MKSETIHRMTRRLADWDYRQRAIYSITVTLADRSRPWLGRLETPAEPPAAMPAKNGGPQNGGPAAANGAGAAMPAQQPAGMPAKNGGPQNGGPAAVNGAGAAMPAQQPAAMPAKNGGPQNGGPAAANGAGPAAAGDAGARGGAFRGAPFSAHIVPSPFGEAAVAALREMPRVCPQVRLIEWQLMPEHFHFIVFVTAPMPRPLGALVRGFKAGAARRWLALAREGAAHGAAPRWAEGFQDTILFHEGQLRAEIDYLRDNPRRLAEKRANPALFRRVAAVSLPLDGGRLAGRFEALGNLALLRRPLVQVQCSRRHFAYRREPKPGGGLKIARDMATREPSVERTTPEYEAIRDGVFGAAMHGAVVISPCISDGERQIAREALSRGFRLVAMRNMGFSPLQKPAGRLFDACAEGRLLLLAPAAWPYQTQEKPMTRNDATALNRICQWLADNFAKNGEAQNGAQSGATRRSTESNGAQSGEARNFAENGEAQSGAQSGATRRSTESNFAENGEAQNGAGGAGRSVPGHSCPGGIVYHGAAPGDIDRLAAEAVMARAERRGGVAPRQPCLSAKSMKTPQS